MVGKRAIRIRVKFPASPLKLTKWSNYARDFSLAARQEFDRAGGWTSDSWWFYRGIIPPAWFLDVCDLRSGKTLTSVDVAGEPVVRGVSLPFPVGTTVFR